MSVSMTDSNQLKLSSANNVKIGQAEDYNKSVYANRIKEMIRVYL